MNKIKILAIETSGKICSIALCSFENSKDNNFINAKNFEIISEYNCFQNNNYDKLCAELCRRILSDNNLNVEELDAIAISIGPGSFTGLRIGLSVCKGLCFYEPYQTEINFSPKMIAVPTLNAIANNIQYFFQNEYNEFSVFNKKINSYDFLSIIYSHRDLVYWQLFDVQANPKSEIILESIDNLKKKIKNKNISIISSNSLINLDFGCYFPFLTTLTAVSIARVASLLYVENKFANPNELKPLYMQNFILNKSNNIS